MTEGYKDICYSKICRSKQIIDVHKGSKKISKNRDEKFIELQNSITEVNDEIIKQVFKYDKYIDLLINELIINYLKNRYKDSSSLLETVQRIRFGVEEKPKCPTCGNPVVWIGKKSKMYTTYCSDKCLANNEETKKKNKATLLEHQGTENCYDSSKYKALVKEQYGVEYHGQRPDVIAKRNKTLLDRYGTTTTYKILGVLDKVRQTNLERYGYDCVFQIPEIKQKSLKTQLKNKTEGTSKMENQVYEYFLELGYKPERFVMNEAYHNYHAIADFYLKEYDLYIEYQGSQYHHGSAYFGFTEKDKAELKLLQEKDEECRDKKNFNNQYRVMINTWTMDDVNKRVEAFHNKINLLEIYSCKSASDLKNQLDFYLAARFKVFNNDELQKLSNVYPEYFQIYGENPMIRRFVIQDAMSHLDKKEYELEFIDVMRSFDRNKHLFKRS